MKAQTNDHVHEHRLQRILRNNSTDAERHLWRYLRARQLAGHKFRRQHPFLDFILDFVCLEARLVVELDGGQHVDSASDRARDAALQAAGLRILRFWNNQVLNETTAVLEVILSELTEPHPHPNPSTASFAKLAGYSGGEQCSPKPRLRPLEGEGANQGSDTGFLSPLQGGSRRGDGVKAPPNHPTALEAAPHPHPNPPLEGEGANLPRPA